MLRNLCRVQPQNPLADRIIVALPVSGVFLGAPRHGTCKDISRMDGGLMGRLQVGSVAQAVVGLLLLVMVVLVPLVLSLGD